MAFDLLERRRQKYMIWIPATLALNPPSLVLGTFNLSPPATVDEFLTSQPRTSDKPNLWELDVSDIKPLMKNGIVYHYRF
jgi:hypothetical protein